MIKYHKIKFENENKIKKFIEEIKYVIGDKPINKVKELLKLYNCLEVLLNQDRGKK